MLFIWWVFVEYSMRVGRKAHVILSINYKIYNYIQVGHPLIPVLQHTWWDPLSPCKGIWMWGNRSSFLLTRKDIFIYHNNPSFLFRDGTEWEICSSSGQAMALCLLSPVSVSLWQVVPSPKPLSFYHYIELLFSSLVISHIPEVDPLSSNQMFPLPSQTPEKIEPDDPGDPMFYSHFEIKCIEYIIQYFSHL